MFGVTAGGAIGVGLPTVGAVMKIGGGGSGDITGNMDGETADIRDGGAVLIIVGMGGVSGASMIIGVLITGAIGGAVVIIGRSNGVAAIPPAPNGVGWNPETGWVSIPSFSPMRSKPSSRSRMAPRSSASATLLSQHCKGLFDARLGRDQCFLRSALSLDLFGRESVEVVTHGVLGGQRVNHPYRAFLVQ